MNNIRQEHNNSTSIRQEIQRFEGVHPNIYAVYELIQNIEDINLQSQIRDHVINIEDSFVNSQEWTLSKSVPQICLGIVGNISSGKSALVHRFLTGSYVREESPEGGRFKKDIVVDNQSFLLLIRDEGGPPEIQFSSWVDGVIFVFSLDDEGSFHSVFNYFRRLAQFRSLNNVPLILVGTQDSISSENPRVISDERAKKLAADLKRCAYYETCATYGLNVDRVFHDIAQRVSLSRRKLDYVSSSGSGFSAPSTPLHRSVSTSSGIYNSNNSTPIGESSLSIAGLFTPTPLRKSSRRKSNLFSARKVSESEEKKRLNDLGFGRNIPVKQGWLHKRTSRGKISNKDWKKKYVALEDDGKLTYYSNMHDYRENIHKKSLYVMRTMIKVPGRHPSVSTKSSPVAKSEENLEFHLVSMDGDTWQFLTSSVQERDSWVTALERQIMLSLQSNSSHANIKQHTYERSLNEIAGNSVCVDCGAENPTWASLNLGCLMCIECSGIHRNLGTHISRIRSLELDDWPPECRSVIEKVGNLICNSVWEGNSNIQIPKPKPTASREEREMFIHDKYERKLYLLMLPSKYGADIGSSLCFAIADGNTQLIMHLLAYATKEHVTMQIGPEQQTALHVASSVGDLASVQLLLWLRGNPCQEDALGQTPLRLAEQNGHQQCYKLLNTNRPSQNGSHKQLPQQYDPHDLRRHVNYMYTSAI
uniref:Arf-GAP with GTPase, ANK repeat and PH domain-containing protein 3 n=1 Tax=Phallusia mammillata TaxID=59560 RepID=A0A6F9D6J0_9ASCI|nr:arf-GAP with GTPase, ANK repeat and PH domain-containing protein 3 [Phallusia mammillata]